MRAAHADYYRGARARASRPSCAGAGQAEAVAAARPGAAEPPRGGAPPRLHRPARRRRRLRVEPAHLLVDRRASSARCGVWMLELLGKEQPITPHTRAVAWFFALWGEMWQRPSRGGRRGPRRVRAAVHRERRRGCRGDGARRAGDRARAVARPRRRRPPRRELTRRSRALHDARQRLGARRSPRSRSAGSAWLRGDTDEALAHFDRGERGRRRRAATCSRARSRATTGRACFWSAAGRRGRAGVRPRRCWSRCRLHYEEGVAYGLEGMCAVAAARGDGDGAPARSSAAAAAIRQRIGVFDVEAFAVHTLAPRRAARERPRGRGRGRARGRAS